MIQKQKGIFRDGLLGIGKLNHWRPILPASLIERTVKNWHQSVLGGHIGARKLMSTMSRYIIIPAATSTVKRIVESCAACKQRKPLLVNMDYLHPNLPLRRGKQLLWILLVHIRLQMMAIVLFWSLLITLLNGLNYSPRRIKQL